MGAALILVVLMVTRPTTHDFHIEDVVIFPLSLVPNAWGLWNMLYVWIRRRRQINAGIYGALLVVAIVPLLPASVTVFMVAGRKG